MPSPISRNFSAGELSPAMYANADMVRYQQGLKVLRNAIVLRTGGVQSRAGTEYLGSSKGNGVARLVPAVFDDDASYVLEFGDEYVRFWENGALIDVGSPAAWLTATVYTSGIVRANGGTNYVCIASHTSGASTEPGVGASWQTVWYALTGTIYEWPTPYLAAQLFEMQIASQTVNVLSIVHNAHAFGTLTRISDAVWQFKQTVLGGDALVPENVAVSGTGGTGWGYAVAAWVFNGTDIYSPVSGFVRTNLTGTLSAVVAALSASPRTVTWDAISLDDVTAQYGPGSAFRGYVVYFSSDEANASVRFLRTWAEPADVTATTFVDNGASWFSATLANPTVRQTTIGGTGAYAGVIGAYQQRTLLSGTIGNPDIVYASRVATTLDFNESNPMVDSDSLSWRQVGRRVNRVRHFAEIAQRLVQFSSVGESIIQGDTDGILRPGEVNPRQFSENGAATSPSPLVINDSALYVQARGAIVRDIAPIEANGFAGSDVTLQAAHLVDGFNIVDWCYQQTPDSVVWAVRDDGTLLSLTYVRELGVLGWATHDTDGTFESVCCVPENGRDAVYAIVKRTIDGNDVRYVERFADRLATTPVLVDAGVTATTTLVNGVQLVATSGYGTWTQRTTPALRYAAIASNGTCAVAVSYDGDTSPVIRSTNGTSWSAVSAGTAAYRWNDVIWVEDWGMFVAVSDGSGDTQNVMTSPTGETWTLRTAPDATPSGWYAIAYAPALGKAVVVSGGDVMTSINGTAWVNETPTGGISGLTDVAWSESLGLFVAISASAIYTSANGIAWTSRTIPLTTPILSRRVTWCGDRFAVYAYNNNGVDAGVVLTSTDGTTWVANALPVASPFAANGLSVQCAAYNATDDVFMLMLNSDYITTSDFSAWTDYSNAQAGDWYDLQYAGVFGRWIASGIDGDTTDIQDVTYNATPRVNGLTFLEGQAVSVASSGVVVASPNNPAYPTLTVSGGSIALPAGTYTSVTVGLPIVTDIQTLDIDTSGGTLKPGKFLITAVGAWTEETLSFFVGPEEPTTATGLTLPSGGFMQAMQVLDRNENPVTTPQTGFRTLNFEGRWSDSGSIFIRNIDPTPLTVLALVPYGTYPR